MADQSDSPVTHIDLPADLDTSGRVSGGADASKEDISPGAASRGNSSVSTTGTGLNSVA